MVAFVCVGCGQGYPEKAFVARCPNCGNLFDLAAPLHYEGARKGELGIYNWGGALNLPKDAPWISLGEGATPCLQVLGNNQQIYLKMESANPTGSYKDRGSATTVSWLAARGVGIAVEDSSGNAGASFAAYAARAGIQARVYVPASASGPKLKQIEMYGAELVKVPGPRSAATEAVMVDVQKGVPYASHADLPFGLPGIATIAYELVHDLGGAPGTVIAPVGHGGLMLGIVRGFEALLAAAVIDSLPVFVGVQTSACAPYAKAYEIQAKYEQDLNGATCAEGVRVQKPSRIDRLKKYLASPAGKLVVVPEEKIMLACNQLAKEGIIVEPTSALAWAALEYIDKMKQPVVLIMTGSGYKVH